ncbi:sulfurtransferase [Arenimonas sp. GDDSR-1]|uniref:sulfurtransferase n=1 Tax=Arenimonas sp. GDDSR-1 TaxID=2950125 RepID=UPI0026377720|nr:sulfurtransferase [Arenimonas sp. GDDSR-1]
MSLISAPVLAGKLFAPNLKILDARYSLADAALGRHEFLHCHIRGAQYLDLNADLSGPKTDPRQGRHPLPSPARWQAVLERLGITPEHEVVIYDQADGAMAAARAWFLFILAGHENVTVLNGGMNAWLALDLPTESVVAEPEPSRYPVHFRTERLIAEDELKVRLQSADALLLDARAPERFRGEVEPLDRKAGHIPGAVNRPYAQNLDNGLFKTPDALRAEFKTLAAGRSEMLLSCGSGVTACHNALALSHAGLSTWRLFAPSWSGWVADERNPIALGD